MTTVKTRFAPSPTGYLHIGGARTALFSYLYACHHGGTFLLRIEDTDRERSTEEHTRAILESMRWLGLEWDEGPYFQSQRTELYRHHAMSLLAEGKAYRCDCPPEVLEAKRKEAMRAGGKAMYDGTCRDRADVDPSKPHVIRFRGPRVGQTVVRDLILGDIVFESADLDDLVLLRSDGGPTYNFVVVVDDALMKITHVIRGNDHVNNTPRQIQLYEAMGFPVPLFGHLPLILGEDKQRLSKRHGATSVESYRDAGFLPEAVVNFLARLGWSHGDQEIFSKEELIRHFDLGGVGKASGVFNEEKLLWLNAHYIKECPADRLAALVRPFLERKGYPTSDEGKLRFFVDVFRPRSRTLAEFAEHAGPYYGGSISIDPAAGQKFLKPETGPVLRDLHDAFSGLAEWTPDSIETAFNAAVERHGLKIGKLAQPLRVAVTGSAASPGIFETVFLVGREQALDRIAAAAALASSGQNAA